ncbi:MAG: DotU family type IV/VI secretion system protein [Deltaproteobacteria bacterium]|nr:DotU family type IV/VI secretion system protein [Deltaproteobacteria bacterium]
MEQSIGVFGQDVLLWACLLRQAVSRPAPEVVLQHANWLLDELKRSRETLALPLQSAEDGMFAICALIDELAMGASDLRPLWSQYMLQATRFNTNNAGVEVFQRLERVRQGPPSVVATYATVLGLGFLGSYALPGQDRYLVVQLRRDLSRQLGVDPDRDWTCGVLHKVREDEVAAMHAEQVPWYRSLWTIRAAGAFVFLSVIAASVARFLL